MNLSGKGKKEPKPKKKQKVEAEPEVVEDVVMTEEPAEAAPKAQPKKGRPVKKKLAKSTKSVKPVRGKKARTAPAEEHMDDGDEVVQPGDVVQEFMSEEVKEPVTVRIPAFEGGFMSPILRDARNVAWHRTDELDLVSQVLHETFVRNGVFIGDIVIKASFVKRAQGGMLL